MAMTETSNQASAAVAKAGIALHRDGDVATLRLDLAHPTTRFRAPDVARLAAMLDEAV